MINWVEYVWNVQKIHEQNLNGFRRVRGAYGTKNKRIK